MTKSSKKYPRPKQQCTKEAITDNHVKIVSAIVVFHKTKRLKMMWTMIFGELQDVAEISVDTLGDFFQDKRSKSEQV